MKKQFVRSMIATVLLFSLGICCLALSQVFPLITLFLTLFLMVFAFLGGNQLRKTVTLYRPMKCEMKFAAKMARARVAATDGFKEIFPETDRSLDR